MKRAFTLLEVMIVILLITLITGAIGYNMKGTLEKGKAFRSERAQEQLHDLLLYAYENSEDKDMEAIANNLLGSLKSTGLAKNPKELLNDGWGVPFEVKVDQHKADFIVHSQKLKNYNDSHKLTRSNSSKDSNVDDD